MKTIYVVITQTRGSAPRDAGTAMAVTETGTEGTIGGGALEYAAIARARALLSEGREAEETVPLGPGLGQCCGGVVTLRYTFERHDTDNARFVVHMIKPNRPHPKHLWLWGAGHVGRAVVRCAGSQAFKITWVDTASDRFPNRIPDWVKHVPAPDMPRLAAHAQKQAEHLVFTYSHDIDLALCDALLRRKVRGLGLIGSATKWARFQKRLTALGHDADEIARITCPIGDKSLGKSPEAIAMGVLSTLGA